MWRLLAIALTLMCVACSTSPPATTSSLDPQALVLDAADLGELWTLTEQDLEASPQTALPACDPANDDLDAEPDRMILSEFEQTDVGITQIIAEFASDEAAQVYVDIWERQTRPCAVDGVLVTAVRESWNPSPTGSLGIHVSLSDPAQDPAPVVHSWVVVMRWDSTVAVVASFSETLPESFWANLAAQQTAAKAAG